MDYMYAPAYHSYFQSKHRYCYLWGGSGSSKSYSAAIKTIVRIVNEEGHRILVIRKVAKTIRSSVYQLLKDLISDYGFAQQFDINKTEMRFTYLPNGNEIICAGLDDVEKLKSIQGITSIWFEEITEGTPDDFDQLDLRMRGETPHYKQITGTFNPISVNHWLKQRVEDASDNTFVLRTTYLDNPFIDADYKAVLDQKAAVNPNYARIYREGEWGLPEADRPFVYNFAHHHISDQIKLDRSKPVYLSFDFNINPMTCTAHQYTYMGYYHTLYEFRAKNTGVAQFCDMITSSELAGCHLIATGDASGRNRSATAGNINNYTIIQHKLKLTGGQVRVPSSNPPLSESRTLTNHIFALHPERYIHARCEHLIADLQNVEADDNDKPKPPEASMGHLLDTLRYMDNTFLPYFVRDSIRLTKKS